ncbi:MAG: 1-deoxy-D-xylulose-5-phosphate reductoisomerase, partial [Planctomycetes bacterium]|nr:1-deoxy-D-xylulose-5-phosphate reductoisomerase [Planctomycetota bacterium]
ALYYPDRIGEPCGKSLDLVNVGKLHFESANFDTYPALELGYRAVRTGGCSGAVLNAANEVAVEAFCDGKIPFGRIIEIVQEVLEKASIKAEVSLETILAADAQSRQIAKEIIARDTER